MMDLRDRYPRANPFEVNPIIAMRAFTRTPEDYTFRDRELYIKTLPFHDRLVYSFDLAARGGHEAGFSKWGPLNGLVAEWHPIVHRQVSPLELVFDCDEPVFEDSQRMAHDIASFLEDAKVPFNAFYSGNKGVHISVFYNVAPGLSARVSTAVTALMEESRNAGLLDLRCYLEAWVCRNVRRGQPSGRDPLYKLDRAVTRNSRHMIRECGSVNPKSGWLKTYMGSTAREVIDQVKPVRELARGDRARFPPDTRVWGVPEFLLQRWTEDYAARQAARRAQAKNLMDFGIGSTDLDPEYEAFCRKLLESTLPDRRRRAVFVLAGFYKNSGKPREEAFTELCKWMGEEGSPEYVQYTVGQVYSSGMTAGMRFIRQEFPDLLKQFEEKEVEADGETVE